MIDKVKIECDTNCIDCKYYYSCESETKLEESTRDFWLNEREQYDDNEFTYHDEMLWIEGDQCE